MNPMRYSPAPRIRLRSMLTVLFTRCKKTSTFPFLQHTAAAGLLALAVLFQAPGVLAQTLFPPTLSAPPDGATNQPTTLTLAWNASFGATSYHLQVSTDATFAATEVNDPSVSDTSRPVGPLATSTTYYWRVRAQSLVTISDWSDVWRFTTIDAEPTPGPTAVTNPATNVTATSATLNGTVDPNGLPTQAEFQYGTTTAYGSTVPADQSPVSGDDSVPVSATVTGLAPSTPYQYQATASNSAGTASGGNQPFTTAGEQQSSGPALTSPPNGATNQSTTLTLDWEAVPLADSYHLQVSTGSAFTTRVVDDSTIASTSQQVGPLSNNTTYYWRVRAKSLGSTTDWSEVWNFTTIASGPTATTNPATNVTTSAATLNGVVDPNGLSTDAKFQYGPTTSYGNAVTANQSPVSGDDPVPVSNTLNGLTPNTTYHYRVVAFNTADTTFGEDRSFTTAAQQSSGPALTAPPNGATGQPTTLTLDWEAVPFTSFYHLQVSTSAAFTTRTVDDSTITSTSQQVGPLSNNTTYYWRVRAQSLGGTTDWSEVWNFTTIPLAPAAPTLSSPADGATGQPTALTLRWNAVSGADQYHLQVSTSAAFGTRVVDDATITGTSRQVGPLSSNTLYYWRVRGQNDGGASAWSDAWRFTTIDTATLSYPSSWSLKTTVPFPDNGADFTAYRLVGLPGASDFAATRLIPGDAQSDWRLFWDNGAPENYLVEHDGSAAFRFSTGRAFWLLKKGDWKVDTSVPSAPLDSTGAVNIPLHGGWNLITNPFTSSIPWTTVQNANSIAEPIYTYRGGFSISSAFEPYQGYYFFNSAGRTYLRIPYSSGASRPIAQTDMTPGGWWVNIVLLSGRFVDPISWFGVSSQALDTLDPLDIHKPRGITAMPGVYFDRPIWDIYYPAFATDVRSPFEDIAEWDFHAYSGAQTPYDLLFVGIEAIPSRFAVYLVDLETGFVVDLRERERYHVDPERDTSKFRVVVGTYEAAQERLKALLRPNAFQLGKNYPNPFNPSTAIQIAVPERSTVELKVFNILGQEVKTLYAGMLETGRYMFRWDGTDDRGAPLASGVYLYRLTTSAGTVFTRKMLLLK